MAYSLTYDQLLFDLHVAYIDARRGKRQKPYQQRFEQHAAENLRLLCDELWNRRYRPGPSTCFIITDPKMREVFAAQFRDRIVHHLYFNYTHEMLERTFIEDSYSCIKHRGTHYGICRLERHIRQESQNYMETCYVLKMDIRGYFMHISRPRLLDITLRQLRRMATHRFSKYDTRQWGDIVDLPFLEYLSHVIIMQDPVADCRRRGTLADWHRLPPEKSLFHSAPGCGLPIGNLTSQLFSNVYLNELDQYAKRVLRCRHYGRYVDDFYVVSADRDLLRKAAKSLTFFLKEHLSLEVNEKKTVICDVRQGVTFLGAYLKPRRRYVSNSTLHRMKSKVACLHQTKDPRLLRSTVNSYLGLLSHYSSYHIRRNLFYGWPSVHRYGYFLRGMSKYVLR
jgi:retron-type reverse transcriptase